MSVSESKYSTFDIVSVSEYLNRIFIISTSNRILSDIINIIYIKSKSNQKYKNKYDIDNIRSYPICFYDYSYLR
jgi:hypothetical protein